eukprot:9747956-Lingulodinium_polyedra.AAC.1
MWRVRNALLGDCPALRKRPRADRKPRERQRHHGAQTETCHQHGPGPTDGRTTCLWAHATCLRARDLVQMLRPAPRKLFLQRREKLGAHGLAVLADAVAGSVPHQETTQHMANG